MWEAVARDPHQLAMSPEAIEHFRLKAIEKVNMGQTVLVKLDNIKDSPLPQLKISPIAAIPHKSKAFKLILNLLLTLCLSDGCMQPSVNNTTIKTAPCSAIDQLGHSLAGMIHAFAEAKEDKIISCQIGCRWVLVNGLLQG